MLGVIIACRKCLTRARSTLGGSAAYPRSSLWLLCRHVGAYFTSRTQLRPAVKTSSALRRAKHSSTMASADFYSSITAPLGTASQKDVHPAAKLQISQGKTRNFPPTYPPHIRQLAPDDIGLRVSLPSRPASRRLVCDSCSSDQEFACSFLQILGRPRHPCCSARSSCHQGLHRDSHPTNYFLARFRLPVENARQDASRHA